MKKLAKILAVVMVIAVAASMFASCGKEEPEAPVEKTKLVMGTSADFPPYEYVEDNGDYAGIDIEIIRGFADAYNYDLEIQDMDFKSIITAVNSKAVDFGMSGFTITDERKLSVNFSDPYEITCQSILVLEGSDIKTKEDLAGKLIGVQAGTTGDDFVTEDFGQDAVNQYDKYSLAIQALLNKQVDCVVLDEQTAVEFLKANPSIKKLDTAYGEEQYAVAFNFEDTELLGQFNEYLAKIKADGSLDAIFAKYKEA
ncbi:MAG: transporter substrate-binding domain-containing protein [Clostridia bacterium]|nr:transporter substrate-binding domain-containing protein [Clostridia bacterium]